MLLLAEKSGTPYNKNAYEASYRPNRVFAFIYCLNKQVKGYYKSNDENRNFDDQSNSHGFTKRNKGKRRTSDGADAFFTGCQVFMLKKRNAGHGCFSAKEAN